jgi:hypothetical protein
MNVSWRMVVEWLRLISPALAVAGNGAEEREKKTAAAYVAFKRARTMSKCKHGM